MNPRTTPVHFLLIEDDDDHAELVRLSMSKNSEKIKLVRVRNGVEGLAYLRKEVPYTEAERPDIILLDLNMPMINGHECIDLIKNDIGLKTIPIIVITTSNAEKDRVRAYQSNANSYVIKPVDFALFQKMVRELESFWTIWNQPPAYSGGAA